MKITVEDTLSMPVADRMKLAEDIWDSLAPAFDDAELPPQLVDELDRRAAAHDADPDDTVTWAALREHLTKQA